MINTDLLLRKPVEISGGLERKGKWKFHRIAFAALDDFHTKSPLKLYVFTEEGKNILSYRIESGTDYHMLNDDEHVIHGLRYRIRLRFKPGCGREFGQRINATTGYAGTKTWRAEFSIWRAYRRLKTLRKKGIRQAGKGDLILYSGPDIWERNFEEEDIETNDLKPVLDPLPL